MNWRNKILLFFLLACGTLPLAYTLHADVVYLKDGQILFGRVTSQATETIVLDQRIPRTSEYRPLPISRADISAIVINIDTKRLQQLDPANPKTYRNLAEEMAVQKRDPEAHEMAIRLFLLGATQGDEDLQAGCFSGLIPLARSAEEERRFRALAHVTLKGQPGWLSNVPDPPAGPDPENPEQKENRAKLLGALQMLRTGNRAQAASVISQPWTRDFMRPYASICSWDQLRAWSIESELKTEWLARTLELEIALGNPDWLSVHRNPTSSDWSQLVEQPMADLSPVSFDNVTEFDLSLNVFWDGQWTKRNDN